MSEALLIERDGAVDWVTLNRPDRLNALDADMIAGLRDYFQGLSRDDTCRVVVLRGAGRGFCAGIDLMAPQVQQVLDGGVDVAMRLQRDVRDIVIAMRRCPQILVAQLDGVVAGGGFVFAMACDLRIASSATKMSAAFTRIGLSAADIGLSYLLPRLVGASFAAHMMLTGRPLGAARAFELGLLGEVVEPGEIEAAVQTVVGELLAAAPLALSATKQVLAANLDAGFDAAMELEDRNQVLMNRTEDFREGVEAFRAKRPPQFRGR